jgi:hypothetical protein
MGRLQLVWRNSAITVSIFITFLYICSRRAIASQEKDSSNQVALKPIEIRITEMPKWQNGCLKVAYNVVNQTANTLWLPINGSRVNAAVWVAASKHGTQERKADWIPITPFFDSNPWDAAPMPPRQTDHEEPCFPRTFHVSKTSGGRGRNLPMRDQIQIVIEYFLTEQELHTNEGQHRAMITKEEAERVRAQAELLQPQTASVILSVPCYPGDRASGCNKRPHLKDGEAMWVP